MFSKIIYIYILLALNIVKTKQVDRLNLVSSFGEIFFTEKEKMKQQIKL